MLTEEQLRVGLAVRHHREGFGLIDSMDEAAHRVTIRYSNGVSRELSTRLAAANLTELPTGGLSAESLTRREEVNRWAVDSPMKMVVGSLLDLGGQASPAQLRSHIAPFLADLKWSTWWSRLKPLLGSNDYVRKRQDGSLRIATGVTMDSVVETPLPDPVKREKKGRSADEIRQSFGELGFNEDLLESWTLTDFRRLLVVARNQPYVVQLEKITGIDAVAFRKGFLEAIFDVVGSSKRKALMVAHYARIAAVDVRSPEARRSRPADDDPVSVLERLARIMREMEASVKEDSDSFELAALVMIDLGIVCNTNGSLDGPALILARLFAGSLDQYLNTMVGLGVWDVRRQPMLEELAYRIWTSLSETDQVRLVEAFASSPEPRPVECAVKLTRAQKSGPRIESLIRIASALVPQRRSDGSALIRTALEDCNPEDRIQRDRWLKALIAVAPIDGQMSNDLHDRAQAIIVRRARSTDEKSASSSSPVMDLAVGAAAMISRGERQKTRDLETHFEQALNERNSDILALEQENRSLKNRLTELLDHPRSEGNHRRGLSLPVLGGIAQSMKKLTLMAHSLDERSKRRIEREIEITCLRAGIELSEPVGTTAGFDPVRHEIDRPPVPAAGDSIVVRAPGFRVAEGPESGRILVRALVSSMNQRSSTSGCM